jgi:hypothetical protein
MAPQNKVILPAIEHDRALGVTVVAARGAALAAGGTVSVSGERVPAPRELSGDEQTVLGLLASAAMLIATTDYGASGIEAALVGVAVYLVLRAAALRRR